MAAEAKIVAIGPEEEVIGLRTVGIETIPADSAAQLEVALRDQTARAEVRLVLVSESVAEGAQSLVEELRQRTGVVIVLVPSHRGSRGMNRQWMMREMERSLGVNLLREDEERGRAE